MVRYQPDLIIAISRKGPRLLELMRKLGIGLPDCPITTELACNFIPADELAGKRVLVFDDITIVGSQVARLREILKRQFPKTSFVFQSFCVDDHWYVFDLARLDLPAEPLPTEQASLFCTSQVRTFRLLNRPYSVDFPILQGKATTRTLWPHLSSVPWLESCDVTTDFQHEAGLESVSSLLISPFSACIQAEVLHQAAQQEVRRLSGVPAKLRSYFNRETEELNLVPMVRLVVSSEFFRQHRSLFSNSLPAANRLIELVWNSARDTERDLALYTSTNYLLSYVMGRILAERLAHLAGSPAIELPREHLSKTDLILLFGPSLAMHATQILQDLDSEVRALPVYQAGFKIAKDSVEEKVAFDNKISSVAKRLLHKLQPQLDEELRFDSDPVGSLGTLFRIMYQKLEMDQRRSLQQYSYQLRVSNAGHQHATSYRDYSTVIPEKRLREGFTWHDLLAILSRYRVLDHQDPADWTKLAFAIDVLVDRGIIVPFVRAYGGVFQRVYRYGENGKDEDRDVFVAKVFEGLFDFIQSNSRRREPVAIASIGMAKHLVLLRRFMHDRGSTLDFLRKSRTHLAEANWLYGTVVVAQSSEPSSSGSKSQWWTKYLEDRHIIAQSDRGGYVYDPAFLAERDANGTLPVYDEHVLAGAVRLLQCAWVIDTRLGGNENKANQWLVCLTSCNTPENFLAAARGDLRLCYEERDYSLFEAIRSLKSCVASLSGPAQLELDENIGTDVGACLTWIRARLSLSHLERAVSSDEGANLLAKAKQCVDQVVLKERLYLQREKIARQILNDFDEGRATPLNKLDLMVGGNPIEHAVDPAPPGREVQKFIDQLMRFAYLTGAVTSAACHAGDVLQAIAHGKSKSGGGLYKQSIDAIERRIMALNESVAHLLTALGEAESSGLASYDYTGITSVVLAMPNDQHMVRMFAKHMSKIIAGLEDIYCKVLLPVYGANYAETNWLLARQLLFPDSNRRTTEHSWVVWIDIKDSSGNYKPENKVKTPILKQYLSEGLAEYVDQHPGVLIPRGVYDRDDERFALFVNARDAREYVQTVVSRLDVAGMFLRIGVSGSHDTGVPFLLDQDSKLPSSEQNHILPKRLGMFVPQEVGPKENYGAHTLVLSNEAKAALFNDLKSRVYDDMSLVGVPRRHKIHYLELAGGESIGKTNAKTR